jgi:thiosulfate dehydrogenase
MRLRKPILALLLLLPLAAAALLDVPEARGDATADKALEEAVKQGATLWKKSWRSGAKGCFACHTRGPNKMTGRRVESYPKYDKALGKVVSAQQKINNMIKTKSGGKMLDLGSDDMNALLAYMKTLK